MATMAEVDDGSARQRADGTEHPAFQRALEERVAFADVSQIRRVRDIPLGVEPYEIGVAYPGRACGQGPVRRRPPRSAPRACGSAPTALPCGVLADHVEHQVRQAVVVDARHHQHDPCLRAAGRRSADSAAPGRTAPRRAGRARSIAVCGSLMPGDSARTATSTSWRTANSRSAELPRVAPSAVALRIAPSASSTAAS